MLDIDLLRTLMGISATPGILASMVGKQRYVKNGKRLDASNVEEFIRRFVPKSEKYVTSSLTPGGGYEGVWCRDSSYVLIEVLEEGKISRAVEWMLWIWSHQISDNTRGMFGRGSPQTKFKAKKMNKNALKAFGGALPTSFHRGYCEVYGASPDIDSNALQISSACRVLIASRSENLFNKMYPKINRSLKFLESRDIDGDALLEQGGNEDWMDTMLRSGKTVYSQGVWIEALRNWSNLLSQFKKDSESDQASSKAKKASDAVESLMWDGRTYVDRLESDYYKGSLPQDVVYYLSVREDTGDRYRKTLEEIISRLWKTLGPACIDPPVAYTGPSRHSPLMYQNGAFWPWITAREVVARARLGQTDLVKELVNKTIPFAALEWVEPFSAKQSGRYPFRTSMATILSTLKAINHPQLSN